MKRALSAGELVRKGPFPCTAPHIADAVMISSAVLVPRGSRRMAAHRTNGSGAYSNAGVLAAPGPPWLKTMIETTSRPARRMIVSRKRAGDALRRSANPCRLQVRMTGTSVNAASTLEKKRVRHRCGKLSAETPLSDTNPASRIPESETATKTAPTNTPTSCDRSNRGAPLSRWRMMPAPSNASLLLLTNQPAAIAGGTPLDNSTARCAGTAPSSTSHHQLTGVSKSAARRIEFGGQRVEMG